MRKSSEEEIEEYRQEEAEERHEREQQRKWSRNAALHPLDPDRRDEDELDG